MVDTIGSLYKQIINVQKSVEPAVYSKVVLTNKTKDRLLSYQVPHVLRLINILVTKYIALDNSDTGIGKTYAAAATAFELGKRPLVICPKTLIFSWRNVFEYFGVEEYDIVNYETIKNGKTYTTGKCKSRKQAPYLSIVDLDPDDPMSSIYKWKLPKDTMVIIDEGHRCKDPSTDNGKLLMSLKQVINKKIPVLILSATICEKFTDMKIPFFLFGLIPNTRNFKHYTQLIQNKYPQYRIKKSNYTTKAEYEDAKTNSQVMIVYEEIKEFSARIRIKDLGDKFPSNQWCAQQFIAKESDEIAKAYDEIAEHLKALKENPGQNHLAQIQKLKQEIELKKIPIFIEQAQLYLDDGKSVIIFVNYLDTLAILSEQLDIKCKIYGDQTMEQRQEAIDLFQSNQERIIICQIRAGGVGISLHDIHGGHPRVTLVNYPDTASDLLQALGRAPRSGAKTPVLQRIIFVANVDYEKRIAQQINRKLANISAINDGDLNGYKYKLKKITKKIIPQKDFDEDDIVEVL
jgi:superfamily II DNA or RNA helicase